MNLGIPELDIVLRLFERPHLFQSGSTAIPPGLVLMPDWTEALNKAREVEYGPESLHWFDICHYQMSTVWDAVYTHPRLNGADKLITKNLDELSKITRKSLKVYEADILDEVVEDLIGCLYSSLGPETQNSFFDSLLACYLAGVWPCGWEGDYPEGNLCGLDLREMHN